MTNFLLLVRKENVALDTLWNKCKDNLDVNEVELYLKRVNNLQKEEKNAVQIPVINTTFTCTL